MLEEVGGGGEPVGAVAEARVELAAKQAVQIQGAAKSFAAAAGKGFHIEPQAAATLIKSCLDSLDELITISGDVTRVGQAPKLGQTPGATAVAPITQQAGTDGQGVQQAISNLEQTLHDMIGAYQNASTNYAETNAAVQAAMAKEKNSLPSAGAPPMLST